MKKPRKTANDRVLRAALRSPGVLVRINDIQNKCKGLGKEVVMGRLICIGLGWGGAGTPINFSVWMLSRLRSLFYHFIILRVPFLPFHNLEGPLFGLEKAS